MTANERAFQEKWLETNSGRTLLEFWVNEKEMIAKSAKMSDLPAPAFSFLLLLIVYHIIQTTKGQYVVRQNLAKNSENINFRPLGIFSLRIFHPDFSPWHVYLSPSAICGRTKPCKKQ